MLGPTSLPALQEAGERGPLAGCVHSRAMRSAAQTAATGRFPHLHLQMRVALHTRAAEILEKGLSPRVLSTPSSFYFFNYTNEKLELHVILGLVGVSKGHC